MPETPVARPDIWPVLRAAGFRQRTVPARDGARPQPAMQLYYAVPDHLVVVLEHVIQRPGRDVKIIELAVYPELADLTAATGGPVERAHARYFGITFEPRTPPAVICAAALAALTVSVPHRSRR